jgi:hypothetical protein
MEWYKVTLKYSDSVIGGKAWNLQDTFGKIFLLRGSPKDAALFTNHDEDFEDCFYYFSPAATRIAADLIQQYGGVPCEAPQREKAILLVGHAGARYALLPAPENS